jgi:SAM-dependent methyltransferase
MDLTLVVPDGESAAWELSSDSLAKAGISWEVQPRIQDASGEHVLVVVRGHRLERELFERLWARRSEAEVVLASRYLRGGGSEASALTALATRLANRAFRRVLRVPCHDFTSGIRLYKRSALSELGAMNLERCSSLELLVRLHNQGFKLREVAFHDRGERGLGRVLVELAAGFRELPRLAKMRRSPLAADLDDIAFDALPPWRRRRLLERKRTIVSFLEVDVPVLDVGCGSSRLIQSLSRGTGLDRDRNKLRFLRGRARAIVGGELPRLPFRDGSFPQVVLSDVIASLAPSTAYLPELRRVLASRGTLVLATGASGGSEASLREELQKHGFAVDEVRKIRGPELVVRAVRKDLDPAAHDDRRGGASAS